MKQKGFTLIELVIAVAIVAILALVAFPSYQQHVRASRRAQAKADLMEIAQLLERQFTVDRDYRTFTLAAPMDQSPRTGATVHYRIAFTARTQTGFTLQAVPQGGQQRDPCGSLTVAQTGARTPTTGGCWP
ncbi:MAG TPA: type IV pilin protein [Tahibacter sp.]|uniref:type IV pilin protein n=1 Tax=Tahibacter sp. TaxID=2056211 RepID=UPI002B7E5B09|nr:type IV pilin protein [Tahibacter sp.]HSX61851.1 type IV pilin protein [Tahibacter sp.]